MKFFRSLLLIMLLGVFINSAFAASQPKQVEKPENVVASLYKEFGWEIKSEHSSKRLLIDQPMTVLERYFSKELAQLIVKDKKYEKRTNELGHLDFVLIAGSQDPDGISNIRITRKPGTNIVAVLYDQNGEKDVMKIDYHSVQTGNGWRISDVRYKARKSTVFPDPGPELSLLKLLFQLY